MCLKYKTRSFVYLLSSKNTYLWYFSSLFKEIFFIIYQKKKKIPYFNQTYISNDAFVYELCRLMNRWWNS